MTQPARRSETENRRDIIGKSNNSTIVGTNDIMILVFNKDEGTCKHKKREIF